MMKLEYFDSEATKEELLQFLDAIVSNPLAEPLNQDLAKCFYETWRLFILNYGIRDRDYVNDNRFIREIYPLEHNSALYEIVIHFDVTSTHDLLRVGKLIGKEDTLERCKNNMHYSDTGDKFLMHTECQNPVLIVCMPHCDKNGKLRMGEVIDGNHRVSAAIASDTDIPVTQVVNVFFPPEAFLNDSNWFIYHILIGFYFVVGNLLDVNQQRRYLADLMEFLHHMLQ